MAKTTVELRQLIAQTEFDLFDFDYKCDDQTWKAELEQYITDYYYFYEIGQLSVAKFKHRFSTKMRALMPYYNELYNTTLLNNNPLLNYKLTETLQGGDTSTVNNTGTQGMSDTGTDSTTNANTTTDKYTEYPQHEVIDDDILANKRAVTDGGTNTTKYGKINTRTDNLKQAATRTNNYSKTIEGLTGTTYSELIKEYRSSLLRINKMIIDELKSCFLLIY
jgi:hypothetical protein